MSTMLLSVKPAYARAIIDGEKQFEFRKVRCRHDVTHIIFYSTAPQKQVVCEADVDEVLEDSPLIVWQRTEQAAGVSREFFDRYYAGRRNAVAFHLTNVVMYDTPRMLSDFGLKFPPQSYVYIT